MIGYKSLNIATNPLLILFEARGWK